MSRSLEAWETFKDLTDAVPVVLTYHLVMLKCKNTCEGQFQASVCSFPFHLYYDVLRLIVFHILISAKAYFTKHADVNVQIVTGLMH